MAAIHKDMVVERGANWRMLVWYPGPPDPVPVGWQPNDLSVGWKAFVQVRSAVDDTLIVLDASADVTLQAGSVTTPNLILDVPPASTLLLPEGDYQWSWWLGQTASDIASATYGRYLFEGTLSVVARSTH